MNRIFCKNIFRSIYIDLCILRDACDELFCVFGDFYASGTQDTEVTKSLKAMGNPQPQPLVTALPIAYSCSDWKVMDQFLLRGLDCYSELFFYVLNIILCAIETLHKASRLHFLHIFHTTAFKINF